MTKPKSGAPAPPKPPLDSFHLRTPFDFDGKCWDSVEVREPTAEHLWGLPAAAALSLREQSLVTAARVVGLEEHRREPFCRELIGQDFAEFCARGSTVVSDYNRGQTATIEELEPLGEEGGLKSYTVKLENGFRGPRPPGSKPEDPPPALVLELTFRRLTGADVWNTPATGLLIGHLGDIATRATGYSPAYFKRMTPVDLGRVLGVAAVFLAPFRPTGATP